MARGCSGPKWLSASVHQQHILNQLPAHGARGPFLLNDQLGTVIARTAVHGLAMLEAHHCGCIHADGAGGSPLACCARRYTLLVLVELRLLVQLVVLVDWWSWWMADLVLVAVP